MIERLGIALIFVAMAALIGLVIQRTARARSVRLASNIQLNGRSSHAPRLIVFTSKWCCDCITQHEMIEQFRGTLDRPVEISYHDAVTEGEFAKQFGIMMVPALVMARSDGAIVEIRQGLVDEDRLRSLIEAAA